MQGFKHGLVCALLLAVGWAYGQDDRVFQIGLANDIMNFPRQTDRYFSNGVHADYRAPAFRRNPLNYLIPGNASKAIGISGLRFTQNIYTPQDLRNEGIVPDDRPFAAYSLLESYKQTLNEKNQYRLSCCFHVFLL